MAYLPSKWLFLSGAAAFAVYVFSQNPAKPDLFLPTKDNLKDRIILESANPIVVDGDTIKIGDATIRIIGIDAPDDDFAQGKITARSFLTQLLNDRTVKCRSRFSAQPLAAKEIEGQPSESFGRVNMSCSIDDRYDLGRSMVEAGYAVDYKRYSGQAYSSFAASAQTKQRGLWLTYPREMEKLSILRQ